MLELKKINLFHDRSPNDVVFDRIIDFFSIENTILFINFDLDPDNKKTKPAFSKTKYTNLTIRNIDDLNVEYIQQYMFRVDMVAFLIDEWPYDHILKSVVEISTKLNKTSLINMPSGFNIKMANQLGYNVYSLEKKRKSLVSIQDLMKNIKEDQDGYYQIIDEIDKSSYTFLDYKKSLIRDRKIGDIID
jgi:hypothetical protein